MLLLFGSQKKSSEFFNGLLQVRSDQKSSLQIKGVQWKLAERDRNYCLNEFKFS